MAIKDHPHYVVSSRILADWLDSQDDESWWSIDGDHYLSGLLSFPCPSDELSPVLREMNKDLLIQDLKNRRSAKGQRIGTSDLDKLCVKDQLGNREFLCQWADAPPADLGWILAEDTEAASMMYPIYGSNTGNE